MRLGISLGFTAAVSDDSPPDTETVVTVQPDGSLEIESLANITAITATVQSDGSLEFTDA